MLWWGYPVLMAAMMACDLIWIWVNLKRYINNITAIQNTPYQGMWNIIIIPIYALMYIAVVFIALPLFPIYNLGAGAIVGCVVYGVYNLCLLLQFKHSSVYLAFMDTCWGTALFMGITKLAEVMEAFSATS
jgi:uncharacterized membrane protein